MRALLLTLVASTAFAAKPTFDDVLKKFQPAALPLSSKALPASKFKLGAAEVAVLGLTKAGSVELKPLAGWKPKPEDDVKTTLVPLVVVTRPNHVVLVMRMETELPVGVLSETFLVTYGPKGELLDGLRFSSGSATEAGTTEELATLTSEGSIGRRLISKLPMMEEGLPPELQVVSEQPAKLTRDGHFELGAQVFTTRDGAFIDHKSKEELRVFGEKVFYRANDTKPFQLLLREGDAVRFRREGKQYVLSWDERRKTLSCTNPDGSAQAFTREW